MNGWTSVSERVNEWVGNWVSMECRCMQSNRHRTHVSNSKDISEHKREKRFELAKRARRHTAMELLLIFYYCLRVYVCTASVCPFQVFFIPSNSHVCYTGKRGISHAYTHLHSQRNAFNLPKVFACITEMFACAYECVHVCVCERVVWALATDMYMVSMYTLHQIVYWIRLHV